MTIQRFDWVGVPLSDLTNLEYCTYVESNTGTQAPALQINFDDDVTDGDTSWKGRLVFEPANQGETVLDQTWQCWDALSGKWWSSSGLFGEPRQAIANNKTFAEILALFPNAGFNSSFGGLLLKAGSGWGSAFDGNADMLSIGVEGVTTTYDFEAAPSSKADCKKGGWKDFGFKNQGQCVATVASGKDKRN